MEKKGYYGRILIQGKAESIPACLFLKNLLGNAQGFLQATPGDTQLTAPYDSVRSNEGHSRQSLGAFRTKHCCMGWVAVISALGQTCSCTCKVCSRLVG